MKGIFRLVTQLRYGGALIVAAVASACPLTTICSPGDPDPACGGACRPGDTRPQCSTPTGQGSLALSWTIDGQPPQSACAPANASAVRISLDSGAAVTEACANGARTLAGLVPKTYEVLGELLDGAGTPLVQVRASIAVLAGQQASAVLAFQLGGGGGSAGTAVIQWTVNGGQQCPSGNTGLMTVTVRTVTEAEVGTVQGVCDNYQAQIEGIAPGTYHFDLTLTDSANPGQAASARVPEIAIMAGAEAAIGPVDVACPFCGGGGS